jgi:hypothetical protein
METVNRWESNKNMETAEESESWQTISMEAVERSQSWETISLTVSIKRVLLVFVMITLLFLIGVFPLVAVFWDESEDVNFCMNETLVY